MAFFTPPLDFFLQVRKKRIEGHLPLTINGENSAVGTSWETLWPEGGLANWPSSAQQMTLSSSSTDDTSAGTGLRTLRITGLAADYTEITEDITLNGQTGVTTTNSYLRINDLQGLTAGNTGENQGDIYMGTGTITAGKPDTVYASLYQGYNTCHCGRFTVAKGMQAFLIYSITSTDTAGCFRYYVRPPGGIWSAGPLVHHTDTAHHDVHVSEGFPEGTDFEIRGKADTGTAKMNVYIEFVCADTRSG
jgi:hypothetical protein